MLKFLTPVKEENRYFSLMRLTTSKAEGRGRGECLCVRGGVGVGGTAILASIYTCTFRKITSGISPSLSDNVSHTFLYTICYR